jgi:hypothetical protein
MSLSTCPILTVQAGVDRVWSMLADSAGYDRWWDAVTESIEPLGPAHPGQVIRATAHQWGGAWRVWIEVVGVDPDGHVLDLVSHHPLAPALPYVRALSGGL